MKSNFFFLFSVLLLIFASSLFRENTIQKNDFRNNFDLFSTNNKFQFSETDKIITIIEENNSDNDEEFHSNDNQTKIKVDFCNIRNRFFISINKNLIPLFDLNFYNNQFVTLPTISTNSNPLYLQQKVFKI